MIDLNNEHDIVEIFVHRPGRKMLIASDQGRGFVVDEDSVIAQTRNGKQVMNVKDGVEASRCLLIKPEQDAVAVIGENRKLLVFQLDEVPEMTRGRG